MSCKPSRPDTLVLLLAGLTSVAAVAQPSEKPNDVRESFLRYRAGVIRDGWVPRQTALPFGDGLERSWGSALAFYQAGFHEVEICAGTGVNPCIFNYVRGAQCLRVHTVGEQPEDAAISDVSHECPPDEALKRPGSPEDEERSARPG